ncbi:hypothetical protein MPDQ_001877 [Monascus purpureus]|uniref:Uncharacterized protein n=1 Tax=Monascus purpureus TaxID=5098 RepID=A0A507QP75_MONPU|nr:hypothetical protein MPDQ_001877 [Monascus purpureus]BDD62347.1 hypothetical protein MAP00_007316 [Monascus purpureus]
MPGSLLRSKKRRVYAERSPFSSPCDSREGSAFFRNEAQRGGPRSKHEQEHAGHSEDDETIDDNDNDDDDNDEEENPHDSTPLLPIFSTSHLDSLPVYNITHAIRSLIAARCETTLTWDQLRSPQISQFLVKPVQQKILASHFSRATLYALMANCLQFNKEVHLHPGNSGTSQSRAMMSELLAIKLLKEYTTRELIDALSYEFYPLQGQTSPKHLSPRLPGGKQQTSTARVSCLEVAIRAQAKRFLSHPVVVQQLQAIWAGTIVFHSAADNLHRQPTARVGNITTYGTTPSNHISRRHFLDQQGSLFSEQDLMSPRRSVTLYDPRDASLFKLSRLRVPLYRHLLSTLSFAILLVLFLAVLREQRLEITLLEIVFWFWSAGFMLDEIVGFNEQGFSLYLMSFWNIFDLGILLLLFCYYCMRLYGVVIPFTCSEALAAKAYDVLAANAVLLFPRLFSTLDHYRYFSQLLIAFRIMAADLVAVIFLVVVACSGFFVAFMSFSNDYAPGSVVYALFQMLMGFTPTAWALWDEYNSLGRAILTIFLFICHFVVVTILITVLTNSFMAIVQNANQEHQFLFAVNTISMVKSDALFSYVAPTNILAWLITPLRYWMPFRQFIKLNRTIIKITHFPILFTICLYEKTILSSKVIQHTDLIERQARTEGAQRVRQMPRSRLQTFRRNASRFFREPSVTTFQKDRALEDVFRWPIKGELVQEPISSVQRQQSSNIVRNWIRDIETGPTHPPEEQHSDEVDHLEIPTRLRSAFRRTHSGTLRDFTEGTRSVASNPEDFSTHVISPRAAPHRPKRFWPRTRIRPLSPPAVSEEGDDEFTSGDNGDNEDEASADDRQSTSQLSPAEHAAGSSGKSAPKFYSSRPSTARLLSRKNSPTRRSKGHSRNISAATILHNLSHDGSDAEDSTTPSLYIRSGIKTPRRVDEVAIPSSANQSRVRRRSLDEMRDFDAALPRSNPLSVPNTDGSFIGRLPSQGNHGFRVPFELGSDLGDNKAAVTSGLVAPVPSSFSTHMAYATGGLRHVDSGTANQAMLSKLVLARMNNIEEGFREVIKEVKDLRREESTRGQGKPDALRNAQRHRKKRVDKRETKGSGKNSEERRSNEPGKSPMQGGIIASG